MYLKKYSTSYKKNISNIYCLMTSVYFLKFYTIALLVNYPNLFKKIK